MIRYRVSFLLFLFTNHLIITTAENALSIPEDKIDNPKPPDKLILQKSRAYSEAESLIGTLTKWVKNPLDSSSSEEPKSSTSEDLTAAASEFRGAKYLPPITNIRGHGRTCYECNSEPWIPIAGRSLHFPPSSSQSNSLEDNSHTHNNRPYFREKQSHVNNNNKQFNLYHPPLDQYGAPQASFDFPPAGEVVDFMLPPPYKTGNIISGPGSLYGAPSLSFGPPRPTYQSPNPTYGATKPLYTPPPPQTTYGSPQPSFSSISGNGHNSFNFGSSSLNPNLPFPTYRAPSRSRPSSQNYGFPLSDIAPPPLVSYGHPSNNHLSSTQIYGAPPIPPNNYGPPLNNYGPPPRKPLPTTHLRPVSQNFQPPLPGGGIHTIPLENNLPPAIPSDSYGRPINPPISDQKLPTRPSANTYGAPLPTEAQHSYVEPITLGSGDSEEYGKQIAFNSHNHFHDFESQHSGVTQNQIKASLYQKGLTDVQVVPSVRIADYTASIQHPINLIQSPILDLNIKNQDSINEQLPNSFPAEQQISYGGDSKEISNGYESRHKLSEHPIVVDDTHTSASNINTTYSSDDNSTVAIKRHNDKFLSSEALGSNEDKNNENDLTDKLIQQLIREHNIIEDPNTQIVGIQKTIINPQKVQTDLNVARPLIENQNYWPYKQQSTLATVMVPPKPPATTWLTPVNESFVTAKHSKKLQIIVPYLKAPVNHLDWNNKPHQPSTAIYNREYSTLAPIFVPPPMTTEATNLWTQLVEEIRTAESHKELAHGFAKSPSTTEVYNIEDFLAKQDTNHQRINNNGNLPYDIISLQKNIDDWTHLAYSNRNSGEGKSTTKLKHVKNIPGEYFTTPSYSDNTISSLYDHVASSSNKKEFISQEIEDNSIISEETSTLKTTTELPTQRSTKPSVRFVIRQPTPTWETSQVTLSNSTHEKVYVVTPQSYTHHLTSTPATAYSMAPRIQNGRVNNAATMTRISVRVEAPSQTGSGKELKPVKVVYSEWPHLINDLATTTTSRPTTRHPLFGLVDLAPYTVSANSRVETIGGHSKVTSVVTSPIVKRTTPMPPRKADETVKISAST